MQIEALEKRKNAWKKRHHDFLFLCQDFVKEEKSRTTIMILRVHIHVKAWKFMVMEWIFACSLCTSLIISLLFMSLVLVLDIPLELQIQSKKRMHKNPSFVSNPIFPKTKAENSIQKKKSWKSPKCKSIKCLFYCYLFTNPRDLDKKLWVAQCQSHLNITENWWVAATKIPCTTFSGKKKSGQPFSTVNFGVLESFFISAANDITENTVDDLELNGR